MVCHGCTLLCLVLFTCIIPESCTIWQTLVIRVNHSKKVVQMKRTIPQSMLSDKGTYPEIWLSRFFANLTKIFDFSISIFYSMHKPSKQYPARRLYAGRCLYVYHVFNVLLCFICFYNVFIVVLCVFFFFLTKS